MLYLYSEYYLTIKKNGLLTQTQHGSHNFKCIALEEERFKKALHYVSICVAFWNRQTVG